jgi:hypothetical protein
MRDRMQALAMLLALVCATAVSPVRAPRDARSVFAGTWSDRATWYATAYSKAGISTGRLTCAWRLGTAFLICSTRYRAPSGSGTELSIYTRSAKGYGFVAVEPDGTTNRPAFTVRSDGSMLYDSSFEDKGKHVRMQTVNTFPAPGLEKWYLQYSTDGGATWTRMADGTSRRTGSPARP